MTRRPKGTGSLFQCADGRWVGSIETKDPITGMRKRRSVTGTDPKDVQCRLVALADALPAEEEQRDTLAAFLARWYEEVAVHDVRPKSLRIYHQLMRDYIIPKLGDVKLRDLRVDQVQTVVNAVPRSPATIRHVRKMLGKALQHALVTGLVDRNVARLVSIPKVEHAHTEPWSADDARHFLAFTREDERWPLYVLALSTGARQGELLALRWEDVDLDAGRLRIRCGALLQTGPRTWVEQEAKTRTSRRTLMLEPFAVEALRRQRALRPSTGFVFCRVDGRPLAPADVTRGFQRASRAAGLRVIRFHDLRHTCARLMLDNGGDLRHVMAQLGHSSIATTNDIYGGCLEDSRRQASAIMGRVLAGVAER